MAYLPAQRILNDAGARMPEHGLDPPVPVTARIVWADDGEEYIETVAAGWSGQTCTCGYRTGGTALPRCGLTPAT
jgi:hypothetical protein